MPEVQQQSRFLECSSHYNDFPLNVGVLKGSLHPWGWTRIAPGVFWGELQVCAKATERSTVPGTLLGQALGPCCRPTVLRREWLTVYCWSHIRPKTPFSSWISHSPFSLPCQPRATLSCQLICYASLSLSRPHPTSLLPNHQVLLDPKRRSHTSH